MSNFYRNDGMEQDTFDFHNPTRIIFRPNGVSAIGRILKEDYHFHKILWIYGGESLKKNGTYDIIASSLKNAGIEYLEFGGVEANPDISFVTKILYQAKPYEPELVLASGGGSVMDTAKLVAAGIFYTGNPLDFNKRIVTPIHALPVATIPTIAASGSESSNSCVISDRAKNFKGGFNAETNYPLFSLLDPVLEFTLPPYQTGVGLADMFSHAFERYFSPSHCYEPADGMAIAVMKNIVLASKWVFGSPDNYETRRAIMLCSALAHNGFVSYGKKFSFRVHRAEHYLSGKYPGLVHGQGIALLLPKFLEVNKTVLADKIHEFGHEVFSIQPSDSLKATIDALKDWLAMLPIKHNFQELGFFVSDKDLTKAYSLLRINPKK
ncbi:MAG: iron-containing alcohol dehydrogenase [Bacilli bacterium]|nr:iron-containing alcohol dehydrogenase [Bacilli bacterium]